MKRLKLNAALALSAEKNDAPPKFRIVANTGAPMEFHDGTFAVDVDGIETPGGKEIPVIYGHDYEKGIGHSTARSVQNGEYVIDGIVSRESQYADDFVKSARLGFPWQASIGGYILDSIELKKGEELDLHGRTLSGPCTVATKFELYEVSVVEYGADGATSSHIAARKEHDMTENENKTKTPPDQPSAIDVKAQLEAAAAELERVAAIRKRSLGNDEELQAKAIREGWSPDKFELESLRASRPAAPAVHTPTQDVDDKALEAAAVRAAGFAADEKKYTDQQLTAADRLGQIDFLEFCERAANADRYSFRKDSYQKVKAALSTSNLGSVLTNSANAILARAFDASGTEWRKVFKVSSVADFKAAERWRIDSNFKFKEIPEGAEMEHAEAADEKFAVQAKLFGRQFTLSEQAIVNGDALGVFGELLRQIAFGANEAINEQAWGLLMNPGTCSDSVAFYHANHGSLKASCALTLANLSAARSAFITRKKGKASTVDNDAPLGVPPTLLVVPSALEDAALQLVHSTMVNNGSTSDTPADFNPNYNRFQVVGVPYLGFSTFTNYSDTTWYLFADPNRLAAFEIAFLNGRQSPIVRQDQMKIGTLGIEFDAHCAWGVAQEDYRGALKCTA